MKNIGFAQRITLSAYKVEKVETSHNQKWKEIQKEINLSKVDIDKSVFQKTDQEKEEVRQAKKLWKQSKGNWPLEVETI